MRRLLAAAALIGFMRPALAVAQLPAWIVADSADKTVTLTLEAAPGGPDGIATLSGNHHGNVQLVVPLNWTVKWNWLNRDSTQNHSLVVMAEREKLPMEGGRPALDNALSRAVIAGLKAGQRDLTTFLADQAGWYWILCGVPSHAIRGEWIGLKVDRDAATASVVVRATAP
jgi:hypothetical protein